MRNKVQAHCCSFDIQYSSCGSRKPKNFEWTNTPQKKIVFVDEYLSYGLDNIKNKFGWIAESPAMCSSVYEHIFDNLNRYERSYIKIFTCDESLIEKCPNLFYFCLAGSNLPWTPEEDYGVHEKSKLISFLCSDKDLTEGHKNRIKIAEKFKNHADFYGGIFQSPLVGTPDHIYHHKKKTEAMNPYMFSFAIENSLTDTYFTEKITDCFANGVIPIYYGTKKILNYFDSNGIIFLDDNFKIEDINSDLYYSKIESVKNNLNLVKNMSSADDVLFNLMSIL